MEPISAEQARRLAMVELGLLRATEVLPERPFEGARPGSPSPIYDVNGEVLFHRIPLRSRGAEGYADIAGHPSLGGVLLAVATGAAWDKAAIFAEATAVAKRSHSQVRSDEVRFVAYSYPKIAVQFLHKGKETLMLEWSTWAPVPPARARDRGEPPGNFERWSLIEETPSRKRSSNARRLEARIRVLDAVADRASGRDVDVVSSTVWKDLVVVKLTDTRELRYSSRLSDHTPCYEVRGQQTNVWCVAASVQMLLGFYRYGYTQVRLAQELGLGTPAAPNGLPYSRDGDVVTVLEDLTGKALLSTMNTTPTWAEFRSEIRANRPLVSFIPGHSRTVAGYTRTLISLVGDLGFRGLLVYDPWPPNAGVVTRWENFDVQTYRRTFTAQVTLA
ncbi:MAG: C39 family peptidase [Actinomycetota bacterium]